MKNSLRTNLFIIGAPKSGTTAMSDYLKAHKNIVVSVPKESHYFALDMPNMREVTTEKDYQTLFTDGETDADKEPLVACDASVWYLHSKVAIKEIKAYNPEAKIVVMLRRPDQMVYSMHAQHVFSTDEDVTSFSQAWKLNKQRANGQAIPALCRAPQNIVYDQIAKYAEQIQRVYQTFPKEQVKIVLFEDFINNNKKIYEDVLDFLGLEQDGREDFPVVNANTVSNSNFLKKLILHPPLPVRLLRDGVKKILRTDELGLAPLIHRFNTRTVKRKPLSEELKAEIRAAYANDIQELSELLGRNLSHWLEDSECRWRITTKTFKYSHQQD